MYFLALIFLISSSASTFAAKSHLTCSKSGTHIIGINGVNINTKKYADFRRNTYLIASELEKKNVDAGAGPVTRLTYYNQSMTLMFDAYESWKAYLKRVEETTGRHMLIDRVVDHFVKYLTQAPNFSKDCLEYEEGEECNELIKIMNSKFASDLGKIKEGVANQFKLNKKVIFVSHSAGALFVDTARDYIQEHFKEHYPYTSHLALARPFKTNHDNSYYINFDQDEILKFLKFVAPDDVPDFNVRQSLSCTNPNGEYDPAINHDYISCYLGNILVFPDDKPIIENENFLNARTLVKDSIYRVAGDLENNDENCCNKMQDGKVWINSNGSPGGFISEKIIISGNIQLDKGGQLCSQGSINATSDASKHYFDKDVKLEGKIYLNSPFKFQNVKSALNSELTIDPSASSDLRMTDSNINGKLKLKPKVSTTYPQGHLYFKRVNFYENNTISGLADIVDSTFYGTNFSTNGYAAITKFTNKKGFNTEISISGIQHSIINDVIVQKNLTLASEKLDVKQSKFNESFQLTSKHLDLNIVEIGNSVSLIAPDMISIQNTKLSSVNGNCSRDITIGGTLPQSVSISSCESAYLWVNTTGSVTINGNAAIGGEFRGDINVNVGSTPDTGLRMGMYLVDGPTTIVAPNGLDFRRGNETLVHGSMSLTSQCAKRAEMDFQVTNWFGNISHVFDIYTGYWCTGNGCAPSGVRCDS